MLTRENAMIISAQPFLAKNYTTGPNENDI